MAAPEIRPRSFSEIIDVVFKTYLENFAPLIIIVAVVTGPILLLQGLIQLTVFNDIAQVPVDEIDSLSDIISGEQIASSVILGLLGWIASALSSGALVKAVADIHLGRTVVWQDSIRYALTRLAPLLLGSFLFGLGVAVGIVLFIVPGIILAVSWAVFAPAVVIENQGGAESLARSWQLMSGRRWPSFGAFFAMFLIAGIIGGLLGRVLGDGDSFTFVDVIVSTAISILTTPLLSITVVILYFELRARRTGYDAAQLAMDIDAAPSGPPSPIR